MTRLRAPLAPPSRAPERLTLPLLLLVPVALLLPLLAPRQTLAFLLCGSAALIPLSALLAEAGRSLTARLPPVIRRPGRALLASQALLVLLVAALRDGQAELARAMLSAVVVGTLLLVPGLALLRGRPAAEAAGEASPVDSPRKLGRPLPQLTLVLLLLLLFPLAHPTGGLSPAATILVALALLLGGVVAGHWGGTSAADPLGPGRGEQRALAAPGLTSAALVLLCALVVAGYLTPALLSAARQVTADSFGGDPLPVGVLLAGAAKLATDGVIALGSPAEGDDLLPLRQGEEHAAALLFLVVPLLLAASLLLGREGPPAGTLLQPSRMELVGLVAAGLATTATALPAVARERRTGLLLLLVYLLQLAAVLLPATTA